MLTKSRFAAFEQCPMKLWLSVHGPELASQEDSEAGRILAGQEVGQVARSLVSGGILIDASPDVAAALLATDSLLMNDTPPPIFAGNRRRKSSVP